MGRVGAGVKEITKSGPIKPHAVGTPDQMKKINELRQKAGHKMGTNPQPSFNTLRPKPPKKHK